MTHVCFLASLRISGNPKTGRRVGLWCSPSQDDPAQLLLDSDMHGASGNIPHTSFWEQCGRDQTRKGYSTSFLACFRLITKL